MKLKVYPKINLCLKVYKGLIQGKHRIDSVMCLYTKLHDTIKIKKADELCILYKDGKNRVNLSDCLIGKSLKYLRLKYGIDTNYRIEVKKRIPFGAGLGGGSADAAAVINFILEHNKNIQLDLKDIATELGSDIPFFLSKFPIARVRNLGDHVSPIYNWKPNLMIHLTPIICSTTKVFELLEQDKNYESRVNVDKIISMHLYKQHSINVVYNDLTKYIIQNYKELQPSYKQCAGTHFFTGAGGTIVTIKE